MIVWNKLIILILWKHWTVDDYKSIYDLEVRAQ